MSGARPTSLPWRAAAAAATGLLLAAAALPFVALFPEPPAFGRGAAGIAAAVPILATMGTSFRGGGTQRVRILRRAALLLGTTVAAAVLHVILAREASWTIPTIDLLPRLFGLEGEDVDDAVIYEARCELWLACGAATLLLGRSRRFGGAMRRMGNKGASADPGAPVQRWNAATILLWAVGWAALAGAVVDGHWTAAFLARADHVTGRIASADDHPRIRFNTPAGAPVEFTQNGYVSRPLGAEVPVAYDTRDPPGTAQADTFWVNWSDVLGLLWIGLGFTLFPFFGFRAAFRVGRW